MERQNEYLRLAELEEMDKPIRIIGEKEFLTPTEVGKLLGISRSTVYRYMAVGDIKAKQFSGKTIIRRSDIEKSFDNATPYRKRRTTRCRKPSSDLYSLKEIMAKYNLGRKAVWARCDKYEITKIYKGRNTFWSKTMVDKYFADIVQSFEEAEWCSPEQIEQRFHMSHSAVITWAIRHRIPKFHKNKQVFYSKMHVDYEKGISWIDPDFYTYAETMEKYGINRNQVEHIISTNEIPKKKEGCVVKFSRREFDAFMKTKRGSFNIIK